MKGTVAQKNPAHNKKYMIIAVSVLIAEFTARNNGGAARQRSNPQSVTTYISERYQPIVRTSASAQTFQRSFEFV